jgi:hypothetical protein
MTGYIFQNFFDAIIRLLHKHNWSMRYVWTCRVKEVSPCECDIQCNIIGIYNAVCLKVPYLGLFSKNVLNYLKLKFWFRII